MSFKRENISSYKSSLWALTTFRNMPFAQKIAFCYKRHRRNMQMCILQDTNVSLTRENSSVKSSFWTFLTFRKYAFYPENCILLQNGIRGTWKCVFYKRKQFVSHKHFLKTLNFQKYCFCTENCILLQKASEDHEKVSFARVD